jgi:hypothetical protein
MYLVVFLGEFCARLPLNGPPPWKARLTISRFASEPARSPLEVGFGGCHQASTRRKLETCNADDTIPVLTL